MDEFSGTKSTILFGKNVYQNLVKYLEENKFSKVFILCDENTQTHCIPYLFQSIAEEIDSEIIEVNSGELQKDISICHQLWGTLSDLGGDRHSVLINLGGGVISDMGGFVAATFLRGIPFINIPTTLLGMVDAAIGGKTAVNRNGLKNQIGLFVDASLTIIDPSYLSTLPQSEFKSGLTEMLKHGLIAAPDYWRKLQDLSKLTLADLEDLIRASIAIKLHIVERDQQESGYRKILNFGHTLGHAIESYRLENPDQKTLLHGEAIAVGMVLEAYLSYHQLNLPLSDLEEIRSTVLRTFKLECFDDIAIKVIMDLLKYDKKNRKGIVNFVLLRQIGEPIIDCQAPDELIKAAFVYYQTGVIS